MPAGRISIQIVDWERALVEMDGRALHVYLAREAVEAVAEGSGGVPGSYSVPTAAVPGLVERCRRGVGMAVTVEADPSVARTLDTAPGDEGHEEELLAACAE